MDMVEKIWCLFMVLCRCQEVDCEEFNYWVWCCSDMEDMKKGFSFVMVWFCSSFVGFEGFQLDVFWEFLLRIFIGYMFEDIWRKVEEVVNEVKWQVMLELQKVVLDVECKVYEFIIMECVKMEWVLVEVKWQVFEDVLMVVNQQEDFSESCWNCGWKVSEMCSGCNVVCYCGFFCQYWDWEKYYYVCGYSLQGFVVVVVDLVFGLFEVVYGLGFFFFVGVVSFSEVGFVGFFCFGFFSLFGLLDVVFC